MSLQVSSIILDTLADAGSGTAFGAPVNVAGYKKLKFQSKTTAPSGGTIVIEATSVEGAVAGTPDNASWYAVGVASMAANFWYSPAIENITARWIRASWTEASPSGDRITVSLTVQG